jgi:hypothetical protein
MKRGIILLIALVLVAGSLFAQKPYKVKISKQNFMITEEGFKDAWKNLRKGTRYFRQDLYGSYKLALKYLKQAYRYNPDYAPLNYELGITFLKTFQGDSAVKYLENAFDLDPNIAPDIHLWLGKAYHFQGNFDDAIDEFLLYKQTIDSAKNPKKIALVNHFIQQCRNAKELMKQEKIHVIVTNMGSGVNTPYDEYAPVFAPYDSIVYFTSRRPSEFNKGRNRLVDNDYYEDIYYTSYKLGKWHPAALFPKPINSRGNDAIVAVNPYGNQVIIRRGIDKGTFFLANRKSTTRF